MASSALVAVFAAFPLVAHPAIPPPHKTPLTEPVLWIRPQRDDPLLSGDVECLKWQAYLALRGIPKLKLRSDVAPEGAIDASLPNLHIPFSQSLLKQANPSLTRSEGVEDGQLLPAHSIPAWVDMQLSADSNADPLEGYKTEELKTESRAWVSLLEGIVHAALVCEVVSRIYISCSEFHAIGTSPTQAIPPT